jgi:hypothetical protein
MLFGVAAIAAVEGIMEQSHPAVGDFDSVSQRTSEETPSDHSSGLSTDDRTAWRSE